MGEDLDRRSRLFATALERGDWTTRQAWLGYLALGGGSDFFGVDAFLAGLGALDAHEQDVLAVALNERLRDVYLSACVPYLLPGVSVPAPGPTPVEALAELLAQQDP